MKLSEFIKHLANYMDLGDPEVEVCFEDENYSICKQITDIDWEMGKYHGDKVILIRTEK